jgi:hypothetical protein
MDSAEQYRQAFQAKLQGVFMVLPLSKGRTVSVGLAETVARLGKVSTP